jgi:acylphosphatase
MESLSAKNYLIGGRVQGVGFRYFAVNAAREIGVTGWTRNLGDGRVEVHANGTKPRLNQFEARLRQGPPHADVRTFEVQDAAVSEEAGFNIR